MTLREAMIASIVRFLELFRGETNVTVTDETGNVVNEFLVPENEESRVEPALGTCGGDILYVLRKSVRRLTTMEVLEALESENMFWGESTVKQTLSKLVKDGWIDNANNPIEGKGYAARAA